MSDTDSMQFISLSTLKATLRDFFTYKYGDTLKLNRAYLSSDSLANDLFRQSRNQSKETTVDEELTGQETLTVDELEGALRRMNCTPEIHSKAIYASIKAHREREWQPGDVVRDRSGIVFTRRHDGYWDRVGSARPWEHDSPLQPLTKLEPVK